MKLNIFILVLIVVPFTFSCQSNYLDRMEETEGYSFEDVFMDSVNFKSFCDYLVTTPIINRFRDGVSPHGDFDDVSDNSISGPNFTGVASLQAAQGDYYPMRTNGDATMSNNATWARTWSLVRVANISIENMHLYPGSQRTMHQLLGQSYFYRGLAYFELTRRWGGMPYLYTALAADAQMDLPRLSYQETMVRAAADMDSAAMFLNPVRPEYEWGFPTSVAALAMKAKILLYAASPFAMLEPGAENLWEAAAIAADIAVKAAEDAGYEMVPMEDYYYLFKEGDGEIYRKEILYGRRYEHNWGSDSYVRRYRPPGQLNGTWATAPSQHLVDCFEMKDTGLPIDETDSGYKEQDPYTGRDPRFYESIVYNQQMVMNRVMQIYDRDETVSPPAIGSLSLRYDAGGGITMGFTKTGYYNNKWMGRIFGAHLEMTWSDIRMSELYLIFAEAANEAWGTPTVRSNSRYSPLEALNKVRNRAEMPNLDSRFHGKDLFRERVWNERRVELCFEDSRLFDIRRWHVAHLPENRDYWKMHITKVPVNEEYPTGFKYEKQHLMTRVFEQRHYLFVIKLDDTRIGPNFSQNPGW